MTLEMALGLALWAQVKHFLADFPLQTPYMLRKFMSGTDWIIPLAAHCAVHATFTLVMALVIRPDLAVLLALFDFAMHFVMDRIKASPHLLGRFKALSAKEYPESTASQKKANTYFWWALGVDQLTHHATDLAIIWALAKL